MSTHTACGRVIEEVRELVERFPKGYEGSEPQKPATLPASVVEADAEDTEFTTCQPEFDTLDTLNFSELHLDKDTSIGEIESAPLLLDAVDGLVVGQVGLNRLTIMVEDFCAAATCSSNYKVDCQYRR